MTDKEIHHVPEVNDHAPLMQSMRKRCPQGQRTKPLTDFAPDHSKSKWIQESLQDL